MPHFYRGCGSLFPVCPFTGWVFRVLDTALDKRNDRFNAAPTGQRVLIRPPSYRTFLCSLLPVPFPRSWKMTLRHHQVDRIHAEPIASATSVRLRPRRGYAVRTQASFALPPSIKIGEQFFAAAGGTSALSVGARGTGILWSGHIDEIRVTKVWRGMPPIPDLQCRRRPSREHDTST